MKLFKRKTTKAKEKLGSLDSRWAKIDNYQSSLYEKTKEYHKKRNQLNISRLQEAFANYSNETYLNRLDRSIKDSK